MRAPPGGGGPAGLLFYATPPPPPPGPRSGPVRPAGHPSSPPPRLLTRPRAADRPLDRSTWPSGRGSRAWPMPRTHELARTTHHHGTPSGGSRPGSPRTSVFRYRGHGLGRIRPSRAPRAHTCPHWGVGRTPLPPGEPVCEASPVCLIPVTLWSKRSLLPHRPRARVGERHTRHSLFALGDGE